MIQNSTCSFVTGEGSFDTVLRNDIRLSALKAAFKGGSMTVFGLISISGTVPLVRLHGKINANVYKEILKKQVPNLRTAINQPAVLMQDNAPCYTVTSVKTFISEENVTVMEWPTQSPDINPVVNIWKLLKERAKEKNPSNIEELGII